MKYIYFSIIIFGTILLSTTAYADNCCDRSRVRQAEKETLEKFQESKSRCNDEPQCLTEAREDYSIEMDGIKSWKRRLDNEDCCAEKAERNRRIRENKEQAMRQWELQRQNSIPPPPPQIPRWISPGQR